LAFFGALVAATLFTLSGLSHDRSGGLDEGAYLSVARLLNSGYSYSSFYFDQFPLFPQILAVVLRIGGDSVLTGRLTIVLFSTVGLLALGLIARDMAGRITAVLAILFAAVNEYYLAQARVTMAEVPSIALMLGALVAVLAFTKRRSRLWLALGGALYAASILIKPLALGFTVPIMWWLVAPRISRSYGRVRVEGRVLLIDLFIFSAAAILMAVPFVNVTDVSGELQRTIGFHIRETQVFTPRPEARLRGVLSFVVENRAWLVLALIGTLVALRRAPAQALPLLSAQVISAWLLLQLPPFRHHYAVLVPLVALFAAYGVIAGMAALLVLGRRALFLREKFFRNATVSTYGVAILPLAFMFALGLWWHDAPTLVRYDQIIFTNTSHDTERVITFIQQHTRRGEFLMCDDAMIVYLAGAELPPSAINLTYASTFSVDPNSYERLDETVRDYDVRAFVVTGMYNSRPQLIEWIETHFPYEQEISGGVHGISARYYSRTAP
jgi:hypothetical protein